MKFKSRITCTIMLICALPMLCAISVVNGQTVYNVPPDTPPSTVGTNTIVNVLPDGQISGSFEAESGSIINVHGGRLDNLTARAGATVNMSGGNVHNALGMFSGSNLTLSGGAMDQIYIREGSDVTILGYDFYVDGVEVPGLESIGSSTQLLVPLRSLLSGSLQDGTPFAFIDDTSGEDIDEVITLMQVAPPTLPPAVTISSATSLLGIGMGQTLNIEDGAVIPANFNVGRGGVVEINGGEIGRKFESVAAQITVNDGLIGGDFTTYEGTITEVNGGSILGTLDILKGSILNVSGGSVGTGSNSRIWDSEFNMSGGTVRNFSTRNTTIRVDEGELANWIIKDSIAEFFGGTHERHKIDGSELAIYGGTFTSFFEAKNESTVTIYGQGFQLDGQPIPGLDMPGDSVVVVNRRGTVLTGVLTNGDPIEFELFEFQACRQCEHHDVFTPDSIVRVVYAIPEPNALFISAIASVVLLLNGRISTNRGH